MRTPLFPFALATLTVGFAAALATGCGDDETTNPSGGSGPTTTSTGGAGTGGDPTGGTGGGTGGTGATGGGGGTNTDADCSPPTGEPGQLTLTEVANVGNSTLFVTHAPGDNDRLFIVRQNGEIHLLKDGATSLFLDVGEENALQSGGEKGLLGLAFHPSYTQNGRFFVHYSAPRTQQDDPNDVEHRTMIQEFQRDASNPDVANPVPVKEILTVPQPFGNHNGGSIEFSPTDGFLYIALGDGGSGGDPQGQGQNKDTLLGAILRIDIDSGDPYAVPAGNPTDGAAEIWDWGLRNPYRVSFDPCTGDLYIGDVGQNQWEEINVEAAGDGNQNYGWNTMEATHCFNGGNNCDMAGLTLPIAEYSHADGFSVTGGVVYRSSAIPWLRGTYFYGDFGTGRVWTFKWVDGSLTDGPTEISDDIWDGADPPGQQLSSFGLDNQGNAYLVRYNGGVYRIDSE